MARENSEKIHSVANDENTPLLRSNQEMEDTAQATITPVPHDCETNNYRRDRPSLLQALLKSIWTSFTINVAVIPISSLMILLLYVHMNTSNVCFEQIKRKGELPKGIMSWILIWHVVEAILINFWFQFTLMFLFGCRKFISSHYSTIILGFFLGCAVAIYKTILYTVKIDFTKQYYRLPGNALFLLGVVYTSYLVASKIDRTAVVLRPSKLLIFIIIAAQFFLGFIIAMVYRYVIIPWFNHVEVALYKAIIAMIAPTTLLIPTMICEWLALKSSSFAKPGRSFVLVFFMNGVSIILYCIMQADVNDIWIFTALSLLSGFFKLVQKPIERFVKKIFHRLRQYIGDACHCIQRGDQVTPNTDHHRRLEVDKDIQVILYENNALIISQAYLALYLIINFDIDLWAVLKHSLLRISIALGINFFANCLFVLIHIHWYNTRFREVWCKHWKRHVMASVLVCSMTILYFTAVLLTVFRVPKSHNKEGLKIKNCTVPSML